MNRSQWSSALKTFSMKTVRYTTVRFIFYPDLCRNEVDYSWRVDCVASGIQIHFSYKSNLKVYRLSTRIPAASQPSCCRSRRNGWTDSLWVIMKIITLTLQDKPRRKMIHTTGRFTVQLFLWLEVKLMFWRGPEKWAWWKFIKTENLQKTRVDDEQEGWPSAEETRNQ